MNLTGKTVAVFVENLYQELEVWYPYYRLKEAGAKVVMVGPEAGVSYPSKLGYPAKSDAAAKHLSAKDFDALVIPGGFAPDYIRRDPAMIQFTKDMDAAQKPLAAICHGPWVLCSTQALKGRKATCFFAIKDDVINAGATYVDEETVVDGHVITARKPDDLPAFTVALMKKLVG
jgi:protease I